jgi:hypothetical protein
MDPRHGRPKDQWFMELRPMTDALAKSGPYCPASDS